MLGFFRFFRVTTSRGHVFPNRSDSSVCLEFFPSTEGSARMYSVHGIRHETGIPSLERFKLESSSRTALPLKQLKKQDFAMGWQALFLR